MMFVIEDMRITDSGKYVSDGFYNGIHMKYRDVILITPEPKFAYGFQTVEEAQKAADHYNKRGYNFVVKNRITRQSEIDIELHRF